MDRVFVHTCRNCGHHGHLYKDCKLPTMSFGVICYRLVDGQPSYLMIQRKDSLAFMEFVRGKFDILNEGYLKELLSNMTYSERQSLLIDTFDSLWNHVWCQPNIPRHSQEYIDSKRKFDTLLEGFFINGRFISISSLISETKPRYTEPEWGFPKGRRKLREPDITCAIREFCEETGCISTDISVLPSSPYRETFLGTNKIPYSHIYYLARMHDDPKKEAFIDPYNIHQIREVRRVGWFSYEEVLNRIREHNHERRQLFQAAHSKIMELIKS